MEKLPTCRICLVEDVRMYVVVNKDLHKLYEKLTDNPFVTEDHRPMLACSFCCSKLKQCGRFQRQCMEAEELFALMLNEPNPSINPDYLEFFSGFIQTPVHHISIVDKSQNVSTAVKEELPEVCEKLDYIIEPKDEHQIDEIELENLDNSYSDLEYKPVLHFESDSEDDLILVGLQTEVKQNQEVSRKKRRANTLRAPVAKKSKPQIRRIKPEDVTSDEQKKYEQPESKVIRATQNRTVPLTFTKHKVKNSRSVHKTTLNKSISDNDNSDDDDNRCEISNKCIDSDDLNEHQRQRVKEKRFKCHICQRGFKQKGHLTIHIRTHTGEKRYECGICQSAFTRIDLLYKHMHSHTGEKPFKCDICKRRFSQKANLKRHYLIHTGEKPYKCGSCQYSCNQKADLKKHIRIHTDEKPYKCDLCQHGCNQKGDLTLHIRKHHSSKNI